MHRRIPNAEGLLTINIIGSKLARKTPICERFFDKYADGLLERYGPTPVLQAPQQDRDWRKAIYKCAVNQARGQQVAAGSGTHFGAVGDALRHSESVELHPANIDGLRQWTTSATLETEPTVKETTDRCGAHGKSRSGRT